MTKLITYTLAISLLMLSGSTWAKSNSQPKPGHNHSHHGKPVSGH